MNLGNASKARISLQSSGDRWVLLVNREPLVTATDRQWLQKIAAKLRQCLAKE